MRTPERLALAWAIRRMALWLWLSDRCLDLSTWLALRAAGSQAAVLRRLARASS